MSCQDGRKGKKQRVQSGDPVPAGSDQASLYQANYELFHKILSENDITAKMKRAAG